MSESEVKSWCPTCSKVLNKDQIISGECGNCGSETVKVSNWSCFAAIPIESEPTNDILLIQDSSQKDRIPLWKLPGGRKEDFENTFRETIKRELQEELGYDVEFNIAERIYESLIEGRGDQSHLFVGFEVEPITPHEAAKLKMGSELARIERVPVSRELQEVISYSEYHRKKKRKPKWGILPNHAKVIEVYIKKHTQPYSKVS